MRRIPILLLLSCLLPTAAGAAERRAHVAASDGDSPTLDRLGVPLRLPDPAPDGAPAAKSTPPKALQKPSSKPSLYEDLEGLPQGLGGTREASEEPLVIIEEKLGAFPIRHLRPEPPPLPAPAMLDVPVFDIWWISTYAEFESHFSGRAAPPARTDDPETPIIRTLASAQPRKLQPRSELLAAEIDLSWKGSLRQNDLLAHKRSTARDYFQRDLPLDFYKTYQQQDHPDSTPVEESAPLLEEKILAKSDVMPKLREPEFLPTVIMVKDEKEGHDKLVERMKELNKQREKERELLDAVERALQDITEGGPKGR